MTEFLTVLAAVDDSPAAPPTAKLAALIADPGRGDKLFVTHAAPPIAPALEEALFPFACFRDDVDELREELVANSARRLKDRVASALPPQATVDITQGDPARAIADAVARIGPDFVVLGSGPTEASGSELGPNARAVIRSAAVPVAIARDDIDAARTLRKILVAIDLGPGAEDVLEAAIRLAARVGGQVQPVFVAPTLAELDPGGVLGGQQGGAGGKTRKAANARWNQIESQLDLPFPVENADPPLWRKPIVTAGDPGAKVVELATENSADVVVVGRCQPGGAHIGRVAEYIARRARTHVVLVPPKHEPPAEA